MRDLGHAIRANPLPATLIGMGLVWVLTGGNSSVRGGFGGAAGQKLSDVSPALGAATPQFFPPTLAKIADLMQRQPLVLGATGLAVGAGVAASLRSTAAEADLLDGTSANVQERAREFAAATAERAATVAESVTAAISQEARAHKLTRDGLKQSASEASGKLDRVIDRSAERLRSRIN